MKRACGILGSKLYLGVKFRAFIFLHKKIGIDTQIHYN